MLNGISEAMPYVSVLSSLTVWSSKMSLPWFRPTEWYQDSMGGWEFTHWVTAGEFNALLQGRATGPRRGHGMWKDNRVGSKHCLAQGVPCQRQNGRHGRLYSHGCGALKEGIPGAFVLIIGADVIMPEGCSTVIQNTFS